MAYIDFQQILSQNWDTEYHKTGNPIPVNAFMFGMVILDWDGQFKRRIRKYGLTDIKIPFQYIENIPIWSKANNYNEVSDVMGRFEPINVYTNSAAQDFTLTLIYNAEALTSGVGVYTKWTLNYIEELIKRLQSLAFPEYDGQYTPPPKLLLNIGNIHRDTPIIIRNVTIESSEPFHIATGLPMMRKVSLECRVSYPLWQGMSNSRIWSAYEGGTGRYGPDIFAYETLDQRYRPKNKRAKRRGSSSNSPFN